MEDMTQQERVEARLEEATPPLTKSCRLQKMHKQAQIYQGQHTYCTSKHNTHILGTELLFHKFLTPHRHTYSHVPSRSQGSAALKRSQRRRRGCLARRGRVCLRPRVRAGRPMAAGGGPRTPSSLELAERGLCCVVAGELPMGATLAHSATTHHKLFWMAEKTEVGIGEGR